MLRTTIASAAISIACASAASAITLIDNATLGLYNDGIGTDLDGSNPFGGTFMFPGANGANGDPSLDIPAGSEPDLSPADASLGDWLTNPATPGGTWGLAPQAIPSTWATNTETAIIYTIDAGETGLTDVVAQFGVDNGIFVWLNGEFLGGHLRPGGALLGEFTLELGTLDAGLNYLQILREDHGGGTRYIVNVEGEIAPIPLPATALLLVGALAGLGAMRRRTS